MFHTSSIGAQQKKKKMAEKITKKNENVKLVLLQSQLILKPDNNHDDLDPQIISVKCEKKVIFHTSDIGGRVEIGLPCTTSQAGGPLKH